MPLPPARVSLETKKLLVVVNVIRPDLGGGVLFSDLCEGLAERGVQVTLKCAYSYYPEWRDKSGENGWKIQNSCEAGVQIERHGLFIPRNPNSLFQRLAYEASFFLSLRRRIPKKGSFDGILVFCPLIGSVAYAVAVHRKTGAPLWLNIQDLSAQAAAAGGIAEGSSTGGVLLRVQNYLFSRADLWSSISRTMIATLDMTNPSGVPIRLFPNWLHPSLREYIRERNGTKDLETGQINLLYSGNIGSKQNLVTFCQALSVTDSNFRFRIQGAGGQATALQQWLEQTGDPRFEMYPLTDEKGLADALAKAHFYVITERSGSGNSFIPSKLIPAIASKTPVLAVCDRDSPLGKEMEEYKLGIRLDWSGLPGLDAVASASTLKMEAYRDWRSSCAERSAYYDRETAITRAITLFEELLTLKSN